MKPAELIVPETREQAIVKESEAHVTRAADRFLLEK